MAMLRGGVAGVPAGAVLLADAACPTGWSRLLAPDGEFLLVGSVYEPVAGATSHTHALAAHTHGNPGFGAGGPQGTTLVWEGAGTGSGSSATHGHTISPGSTGSGGAGTSSAAGHLPAVADVILCRKD